MFKSLFNFVRCAFCRRKCFKRFQIGTRTWISGSGFVRHTCPKDQYRDEYWGLTMEERKAKFLEEYNKDKD